MFSAQFIQLTYNVGNFQLFPVDADWNTLFKGHGHILAFIWSLLRRDAQNQQMVIVGLAGRVLQFQAFVADVP